MTAEEAASDFIRDIIDEHNRTGQLAVDLVESLFGKSTLMRD